MKVEPELEYRGNLDDFVKVAVSAAHQAGQFLVQKLGNVSAREKKPKDFVTEADIGAQKIIQQLIRQRFPDHGFLGEETNQLGDRELDNAVGSDFCWLVDPLDGTTNYIHQLPSFSVSIALRFRQQILVGCVYDPMLEETYTARFGGGAFLNDRPVQTSGRTSTDQALVVCSLPSTIARESRELQGLINVLCDSKATVRRLGSTALNLSYLACGRLDAYWTTQTEIWDVAAGVLILMEAGGSVSDLNGGPLDWTDLQMVAAASPQLNSEMLRYLSIK